MRGVVCDMKKYILVLIVVLLWISGAGSQQAEAYSVTVEKDGIYAEVIPDSFVNNTAAIFKKNVKKAMKYYNKYKDADDYTYVSKVPEEYRDFIPVAKQIQDSDEIIIRNPFYIYQPLENEDGDPACLYYFYAVKNGKKLCLFSIEIEADTGKISFEYRKMMDSHFAYDEKTVGETLYYETDEIFYAETPDHTDTVWSKKYIEGEKMLGADGTDTTDWEVVNERFRKKSYREKKDEILDYLARSKKEKTYKKVEKNLKLELKDEYVEPEKDIEKSGRMDIYIVPGIGIVAIAVMIAVVMLRRKGKKE